MRPKIWTNIQVSDEIKFLPLKPFKEKLKSILIEKFFLRHFSNFNLLLFLSLLFFFLLFVFWVGVFERLVPDPNIVSIN